MIGGDRGGDGGGGDRGVAAVGAIIICVCGFDAIKILISLKRFVWKSNCASAVLLV